MYKANSVSISTKVYNYFMHLRATGKTISPGAKAARTRAIKFTVASIRHGIFVQFPNQCKSRFMPGGSPLTSDVTLRVSGRPVL